MRAQEQRETEVWVPVPVKPMPWVAPNKPIWKLSELLVKHQGEQNWMTNWQASEVCEDQCVME
jgi:hypothetical protein